MHFIYLIFYFVLMFGSVNAAEEKQKICLNMIVKNETEVITRCLKSAKPVIDYWVIVDTGSTDGTQELIKEYMKDIPGELHERPWKNFAHNRNEALELAKGKGDYLLFLDADDHLQYSSDFKMPHLTCDHYNSLIHYGGLQYDRTLLIKNELDWKWHGVVHEYLDSSQAKTVNRIEGIIRLASTEGARSKDPQKYQKDAKMIEEALKEDPTNTRYVFYLAQSYKDCNQIEKAIENYQKRVDMGGWDEEVFISMLNVARLQEMLPTHPKIFLDSYYKAYHYRPKRAEPLYYLAKYYRNKGDCASAYLISSLGIQIPLPNDLLFVEKWIYDYDMKLECSIAAYWIGKYEECKKLSQELLADPNLHESIKQVVQSNLGFANAKILEKNIDTIRDQVKELLKNRPSHVEEPQLLEKAS